MCDLIQHLKDTARAMNQALVEQLPAATCNECGQPRTIGTDGLCHECRVTLQDEGAEIDEHGEVWVPGGFIL